MQSAAANAQLAAGVTGVQATSPLFAELLASSRRNPTGVAALGDREKAIPVRRDLEDRIAAGQIIELDFDRVDATQSFMDELIGILVLERGLEVLRQLRFKRCSTDLKGILQFVVSDRADQHARNPAVFLRPMSSNQLPLPA